MRVALVSPYDPAVPGGVQHQALGLARALARAGDEVLVVAPGHAATWPDQGLAGGPHSRLRLVGLGRTLGVPANGSRAPIAASPRSPSRTRAALARFAPDVVHVHEPFVPGPALAAARQGAVPVVATFHRSGATRSYRTAGLLLGGTARRCARLVAVSEAARATLAAAVPAAAARAEILANAVDLTRAAAAREAPAEREGPTAVFVGRHEPRKGLDVLLEAFAQLALPGARLWVIGDGPMRRDLEARHGGAAVTFLGRLDDAAAARAVAGADVLVAPSRGGESFGVVLLEAMAAGTAVLASDLPGYRLAGGDAARYVPAGDPASLAGALGALLAEPARRAELVAAGEVRARAHGFEALAAAYRERYEAVLPAAARR